MPAESPGSAGRVDPEVSDPGLKPDPSSSSNALSPIESRAGPLQMRSRPAFCLLLSPAKRRRSCTRHFFL